MIDYSFTIVATLIAIFTPKGPLKTINIILAVAFASSAGISSVIYAIQDMVVVNISDGPWIDGYKAVMAVMFYWLFSNAGGSKLAFLSGCMAVLHFYGIFTYIPETRYILGLPYEYVMTFCGVLFLLVGFDGMKDGITHRRDINNTKHSLGHGHHS